jgi:hypothetical protein
MSQHVKLPMDKFIDQYGPALAAFDRQSAQVTPAVVASPEGMQHTVARAQALQLHSWAAGLAAGNRHGFLKKVIQEVR